MRSAYSDVVVIQDILDQLGASLNSGRAILVYGPPGTGKTYLTQRMARVFPQAVLIPHAIASMNRSSRYSTRCFTAPGHVATQPEHHARDRLDPRFNACHRPVVISGGELTADMLEIHYDADTRQFRAPLQLKANNGIFIIDDMGRQRVAPETVFNRWIVPWRRRRTS